MAVYCGGFGRKWQSLRLQPASRGRLIKHIERISSAESLCGRSAIVAIQGQSNRSVGRSVIRRVDFMDRMLGPLVYQEFSIPR